MRWNWSLYSGWATRWTVPGSNPGSGKKYFSFTRRPEQLCGPAILFYGHRGSFPTVRQLRSKFPRLRISGAIPLIPLCAYKAWTAKTLRFTPISDIVQFLLFRMLNVTLLCTMGYVSLKTEHSIRQSMYHLLWLVTFWHPWARLAPKRNLKFRILPHSKHNASPLRRKTRAFGDVIAV